MFRNILQTLGSRFLIGLSNLAILLITTNLFGAEIKGEISLFVLSISIATLISGFAGGPALVYLVPRGNILSLFVINLLWSALSIGVFILFIVQFTSLSIDGFYLYLIALLESTVAINLMLLLGQEKITKHNVVQLIKVLSTLGILFYMATSYDPSLELFVTAFTISVLISLALSGYFLFRSLIKEKLQLQAVELAKTLRLGFTVQIGNLAQILNYRMSYYLLEWLISPPEVALVRIGIFSTATQISESLWQFTRSVNTVQYARIANMSDRDSSKEVTTILVRMNTIVTAMGIIVLLLVPASIYTQIIGAEFTDIKRQMWLLSPGILGLAFSGALSQFFSGIGEYQFNTITSLVTLVLSVLLAIPAISFFEIDGAAAATSIVYILQAIMLTYFFTSRERISIIEFKPKSSDISLLTRKFRGIWNRKL
jgi:O-antigen/teichoic acid export membrane protein